MGNIPHIIEIALLLLVTFLIGCVIGWFFRTKIFRPAATRTDVASGNIVPKSEAPKPASLKLAESVAPQSETKTVTVPVAQAEPVAKSKPKVPASKTTTARSSSRKTISRKTTAKKTADPKSYPKTSGSEVAVPDSGSNDFVDADRPQGLPAPRDGGKDDLKKIKGVGPKLEGLLNGLGIFHFDQIAEWKRSEIDWVDDYLSFKGRIDRDDWIAQAKEFS